MIQQFSLEHVGPITKVEADRLGKINLIIGPNNTGKTILLKALYAMVRAREETGRGDDPREFSEVLSEKLYWTFQIEKLGDLVQKGTGKRLKASLNMADASTLAFEFGPDTTRKIIPITKQPKTRGANSIFLPPKEMLSLHKVIIKTSLHDKLFGFDATYLDLALALQSPIARGRDPEQFGGPRVSLEKMFQGKVEYDAAREVWIYKKGNSRFPINITAEGVKKIAMLDTLLGNGYLSTSSIIFIDEPETALHPIAITKFLDILSLLSQQGMQFFIATHSYFVVKKLYLLALQGNVPIPVFTANQAQGWSQDDIKDGIPDNEIINESIRLFDQELEITGS